MMVFSRVAAFFVALVWSVAVWAQSGPQTVFVQVEAHPTLTAAETSARSYAGTLADVNGFRFTTGWYVVALGPYDLDTAVTTLNTLRAANRIPPDAYLVDQNAYSNQFFPVAGAALIPEPETPEPEAETDTGTETTTSDPVVVPVVPVIPEETRNEALRSEGRLTRQEKFDLQIALQWFGFYNGAIDAAFGRGTRASMAAWQEAKGFEPTGVLTTLQRAELTSDYSAVLASIGLRNITDSEAGITLDIPAAMVDFDRYEAPFAHYNPINDSGVAVLLISQTGDENTLIGLYDIMQTLKIVPLEGERSRTANSFTLTGENRRIKSYTYAVLGAGEIKGFTLIWPNTGADDRRFDVTLRAMRESFAPMPGRVLPDTLGEGALEQSLDLVSGLEIRRPVQALSGFYISDAGLVLTTDAAVQGCARVTLDDTYEARVVAADATLGLALLRPEDALAPIDFARFQPGVPRLQSEVAVAGYSFGGMLSAPTLTFGTLADMRGLDGEATMKRLALAASPGDAGGPVFDASGAVLGLLRPGDTGGARLLPPDVSFATNALAIAEWLSGNGVSAVASDRATAMTPADLTRQAANLTVLVSCWDE